MDALIQKKYFIGKSGPGVWSSVYTYKPQNTQTRKHRGEIFAVIALKGPKEFALATAGNMLLDHFHESYFENSEDSVMIALEKSLLETSHYLQKFLENDAHGSQGVEFDLTALTVIDDLVYVVALGSGKVYVYRDATLSDVSDSLKDPTGDAMIKEASFIAKRGDAYLLGTPKFASEIKDAEIEQVIAEFNEKPLKNRIYKDEAEVAMLLIGYNFERKTALAMPQEAFPEAVAITKTPEQLAEAEINTQDAAAINLELGQDAEFAQTELDKEAFLPYEEQTLEDLINSELAKEDFPLEHKNNSNVDLVEEDDLEDALIEESADLQTQEDTRFPESKANSRLAASAAGLAATGFVAKLSRQSRNIQTKLAGLVSGLTNKLKRKSTANSKPEHLTYDPEPVPYEDDLEFDQDQVNATQKSSMAAVDEDEAQPVVAQTQKTPKPTAEMKTYQVVLLKLLAGLKKLVGGIKALVWDKWLGMAVDSDNIYLRTAARKRKWGVLVVIILIIGSLLYLSINNMVDGQKNKAQDEKSQGYINEAKQLVADVEKNAALYARMPADDARKQTPIVTLTSAEAKLALVGSDSKLGEQITQVRMTIAALRDKLARVIPESSPTLVADLGAKYPNANITDMIVVNKTIYFTDDKDNAVFSSDYAGNLKQLATGFDRPRSITADEKGNLIVMDANADKGLSIVNPKTGEVTRLAATSQAKIGGATQLDFTMVNKEARLYLLNPQQKAVYYYSRVGSSYSTITKRLGFDELASALDLTVIDGRFYFLLQKNLGLMRYFDKGEDTIALKGLSANDSILKATALAVDGTSVYVADPSQKRILVFSKGTPDISLIAQYVYRGTSSIDWTALREIQADRDSGKIFILDKNKIFSVQSEKLNDFQ